MHVRWESGWISSRQRMLAYLGVIFGYYTKRTGEYAETEESKNYEKRSSEARLG